MQAVLPNRRRGIENASLAAGAVLLAAWPLVLSQFGHGDVYGVMGPFAITVVAILAFATTKLRDEVVDRRRVLRDAAIGLACGVVMTVLTYVLYAGAVLVVPGLASHVAGLYSASQTQAKAPALAWTVVIIVAEELLWRGPLLPVMERRIGRPIALALSLVTYCAAQSGSGSPIVVLAAFLCGAIWLAERELTGSMVTPLVSHLVWTPIVIHLYPVTMLHGR